MHTGTPSTVHSCLGGVAEQLTMTAVALARACSSSHYLPGSGRRLCLQYTGNVKRTGCAFATRSAESNRPRPRIQLSRELIRRLWKALGEEGAAALDRIPMNPDMFPLELFEEEPSLKKSLHGRIPVDPNKFPLDLFESDKQPRYNTHDLPEKRDDIDKTLETMAGDSPTEKCSALEREIEWYLKRARKEPAPQFFVDEAQGILELWHQEAQNNPSYPTPSWKAHEWILRGWKRIGLEVHERVPAERANEVLRLLLQLVDSNAIQVQGSLGVLITWVIRLWLRAPHSLQRDPRTPKDHLMVAQSFLETATHASKLILELERRSDELKDEELCKAPDNAAYSATINAFAKASMVANKVGFPKQRNEANVMHDDAVGVAETAARRSEAILNHMKKRATGSSLLPPDIYLYRAVLSAWANVNTREGVARAHDILRQMENALHLQGTRDLMSYKRVLFAYARIAHTAEYEAEDPESPANQALSLLAFLDPKVLGHSRASPLTVESSSVVCPDAACYGAVIQALAHADLGKQSTLMEVTPAMLAERVLDRMEEAHNAGQLHQAPHSHCYGNVIRASSLWAGRSANKDRVASRIMRILDRLEGHILQAEHISASTAEVTRWYNQVIKTVAHVQFGGSPEKADEILERMENIYLLTDWSTKQTVIKPDEGCYYSVLSAYKGSSQVADGSLAARAVNVLHRMSRAREREQEQSALSRARKRGQQ